MPRLHSWVLFLVPVREVVGATVGSWGAVL